MIPTLTLFSSAMGPWAYNNIVKESTTLHLLGFHQRWVQIPDSSARPLPWTDQTCKWYVSHSSSFLSEYPKDNPANTTQCNKLLIDSTGIWSYKTIFIWSNLYIHVDLCWIKIHTLTSLVFKNSTNGSFLSLIFSYLNIRDTAILKLQ